MITIKNNYGKSDIPTEIFSLKEQLDSMGINGFIVNNLDETYDGCFGATKVRKEAIAVEANEITLLREIRTVIFNVQPISKKAIETLNKNIFFAVSYRANRKVKNNSMKKEISLILKVSKSSINIKKASEDHLQKLKVSSGLINPFTKGVVHLFDIDLFKEYYYGEMLTTNANNKFWSLQMSLKLSKKKIIQKTNYYIAENSILQDGESQQLTIADNVSSTTVYIIAYDSSSLQFFMEMFFNHLENYLLHKLKIPNAGIFSKPKMIKSLQVSDFGSAMFPWGCNDNLLKREIEKIDEPSTLLLVPCNILPSLIKNKWLKKNINYITIQSSFKKNLKKFFDKFSHFNKKKITIIGGSHVSNRETSIYLRDNEFLENNNSIQLVDQENADEINSIMLRVLRKDFDSANKRLYVILKKLYLETCLFVVASTSLSLLREHNNGKMINKNIIEKRESQIVDRINDIPILDTLKEYSEYVIQQITTANL